MIPVGRQAGFVLVLSMLIVIYWAMNRARKGKAPFFRKLAAIDALEECVRRAVEMGKPVHVSPGIANLRDTSSAEMVTGIGVVGYTARLAAKYGIQIIPTCSWTDTQAQLEECIRLSYLQEGKGDQYKLGTVRYAPQSSYNLMVVGIAETEKPAANIMIGTHMQSGLFGMESMRRQGAINIAGTIRNILSALFAGGCDYFLMGEEVLAAGAYISDDPSAKGSIRGLDMLKLFCSALILVGAILASVGSDILMRILKY